MQSDQHPFTVRDPNALRINRQKCRENKILCDLRGERLLHLSNQQVFPSHFFVCSQFGDGPMIPNYTIIDEVPAITEA
jgi:hypothetical protein